MFKAGQVVELLLVQRDRGAGWLLQELESGSLTGPKVAEVLAAESEETRGNRDVVLAAMVQCGMALEHAAAELRADVEVVLKAVTQDGHSLQFASVELRSQRRIALTAVMQHRAAIRWVHEDLKADCERVADAIADQGITAMLRNHAELQADRDLVLAAM